MFLVNLNNTVNPAGPVVGTFRARRERCPADNGAQWNVGRVHKWTVGSDDSQ